MKATNLKTVMNNLRAQLDILPHTVVKNLSEHAKKHFEEDIDLYLEKKSDSTGVKAKLEGTVKVVGSNESAKLKNKMQDYLNDYKNDKNFQERIK